MVNAAANPRLGGEASSYLPSIQVEVLQPQTKGANNPNPVSYAKGSRNSGSKARIFIGDSQRSGHDYSTHILIIAAIAMAYQTRAKAARPPYIQARG